MFEFTDVEIESTKEKKVVLPRTIEDDLKTVESKCATVSSYYNDFKSSLMSGNMQDIYISKRNLLFSIDNLYRKASAINVSPVPDKDAYSPINITISQEASEVHLNFDCLPYKRDNGNYDKTHFIAGSYSKAFEKAVKAFEAKEPLLDFYGKRVLISYIFHTNNRQELLDYDNFDLKQLTDWVAVYLLAEDSPSFCSQFIDRVIEDIEKPYLEIIVREHPGNLL